MSSRLTSKQIEEAVWNNTLCTCHYVSGYTKRSGTVIIHCEKHNYTFETSYENLCRANRAHHVCPYCKEEDNHKESARCTCDYCGKEFYRAKGKVGEFNFCCRECKDKAQSIESGDQFEKMRPNHYGQGTGICSYRDRALAHYPNKCALCGWDEDPDILEVHHIDEDRSHNQLDNLMVLCPICHRKLTNHKYKIVDGKLEKV